MPGAPLTPSTNGKCLMSMSFAKAMGNHVTHIDTGGKLLVWLGCAWVVMVPDGENEVLREVPPLEQATADFRMIGAE